VRQGIFPAVDQTWYADDAGAGGKFNAIKQQFAKLQEIGPHYGYYPEPTKSTVSHANLPAATARLEFIFLLPRATAILVVSLVRRILVIVGFRKSRILVGRGQGAVHGRCSPTIGLWVAEVAAA
jgi:hypothetical protein